MDYSSEAKSCNVRDFLLLIGTVLHIAIGIACHVERPGCVSVHVLNLVLNLVLCTARQLYPGLTS